MPFLLFLIFSARVSIISDAYLHEQCIFHYKDRRQGTVKDPILS